MSELKRCPFCGGDNIISTYNNFAPVLLCCECGTMMTIPWSLDVNIEDELRKKWNTRKPMERIVERLEEEILESLSDCGDDWFVAEKVNEAIKIVKEEGGLNE